MYEKTQKCNKWGSTADKVALLLYIWRWGAAFMKIYVEIVQVSAWCEEQSFCLCFGIVSVGSFSLAPPSWETGQGCFLCWCSPGTHWIWDCPEICSLGEKTLTHTVPPWRACSPFLWKEKKSLKLYLLVLFFLYTWRVTYAPGPSVLFPSGAWIFHWQQLCAWETPPAGQQEDKWGRQTAGCPQAWKIAWKNN